MSLAAGELEISLRLVWIGRLLLLQADNNAVILYAQTLWRMAELRYVVYQIVVGDVVVNRTDPILSVTLRAAEQMRDKLHTVFEITPVETAPYSTSKDELVMLLDHLSRLLSRCILDPLDPESGNGDNKVALAAARRSFSQTAIRDWYIKLTFILTTLQKPTKIIKVTTLGFPDLQPAVPDTRYDTFDTTRILKSLVIKRVEKMVSGELLELTDVGELVAVVASGNLKETAALRLKGTTPAIEETVSVVSSEKQAKKPEAGNPTAAIAVQQQVSSVTAAPAKVMPPPRRLYSTVLKGY